MNKFTLTHSSIGVDIQICILNLNTFSCLLFILSGLVCVLIMLRFMQGQSAFTAFIRAYKQHHCSYVFRLRDLDVGAVARGLGLLYVCHYASALYIVDLSPSFAVALVFACFWTLLVIVSYLFLCWVGQLPRMPELDGMPIRFMSLLAERGIIPSAIAYADPVREKHRLIKLQQLQELQQSAKIAHQFVVCFSISCVRSLLLIVSFS